jgi:hypothetical protein
VENRHAPTDWFRPRVLITPRLYVHVVPCGRNIIKLLLTSPPSHKQPPIDRVAQTHNRTTRHRIVTLTCASPVRAYRDTRSRHPISNFTILPPHYYRHIVPARHTPTSSMTTPNDTARHVRRHRTVSPHRPTPLHAHRETQPRYHYPHPNYTTTHTTIHTSLLHRPTAAAQPHRDTAVHYINTPPYAYRAPSHCRPSVRER